MNLAPHLTNTSLRSNHSKDTIRLLEELINCRVITGRSEGIKLTAEDVTDIVSQIVDVLAETFKAGLETPIHFQVSCLFPLIVTVPPTDD